MTRRDAVVLIAAAIVSPFTRLRAQQPARIYRIGMIEPVSAELNAANLAAFLRGMGELGHKEGQTFVLEYRSADGDASRFPALVSQLLANHPDLIITRGTPATLAAKKATTAIPVVMAGVGEPLLIVDSLARPGANITGLSGLQPDLELKRLELLKEMVPTTTRVAALLNLSNPVTGPQLKGLERAAQAKGWPFRVFDVRSREDIDRAFASLDKSSDAVVVGFDLTQAHRYRIAELAAQFGVAAVYGGREFVEAGGLMFYGPNFQICITRPRPMWIAS